MADTQSKIALITGASRGLGRNTALGGGGTRHRRDLHLSQQSRRG